MNIGLRLRSHMMCRAIGKYVTEFIQEHEDELMYYADQDLNSHVFDLTIYMCDLLTYADVETTIIQCFANENLTVKNILWHDNDHLNYDYNISVEFSW